MEKAVGSNHGVFLPNSVGRRMVTEVLVVHESETKEAVLGKLQKNLSNLKTLAYVYVTGDDEALVGVVSIRELLAAHASAKMKEIMKKKLVTVSPETNQEKAADLAVKHNIKAVPVVQNKKLVGVVVTTQIFSILNRALREDIIHLAGIHKAHLEYENTMAVPLFKSIEHRLPWLLIGLLGITMAAVFIGFFEETLQKYLVLAFFIPAIVYMSGALGTQLQTLFIRDLAILGEELKVRQYFIRQMLIGCLLGAVISVLVFIIISIFWQEPFIAAVIAISMFITLLVSAFTALLTTLLIKRFKWDPALGSGPFATIVSDVTSIVIYIAVVLLLIGV
jgi:magnesium transporter